jgi:hypothetical protein
LTVPSETIDSISTPAQLETRLGRLEFVDGVPSRATAEAVYDHLDFVHALNVFLDGYAGASTYAVRRGFHEAGAADNAVIIFSDLMGSESIFLTANADTVYFVGIVDLSSGPMVVDTPRRRSGSSTTCGGNGSSTSACRDPTAAKAAGSCSSRRAMRGPFPTSPSA